MPISTTSNQVAVELATTSDAIPVAFPFFDAADLVVIKTDADDDTDTTLAISTHYTVSGGDGAGGTVTMTGHAALAVGDMITVTRAVPYTQLTDMEEGDPLASNVLERSLDKLTVLIQQVLAKVQRCFRVGPTSDAPGEATLRDYANKVLGFNSDSELTGLDASALVALLNLPETVVDRPQKVWADDAARALAVPDFEGQLGVQLDTDRVYYSTGTSAGNWTIYAPGNLTITAAMLAANAVETAKIQDAAVTLAKMANISATARILGRKTAAAGVPEECTLSEVLDFIGSAARGDILIRGASAWARLPKGSAGQLLGTDGTDVVYMSGKLAARSVATSTTAVSTATTIPNDATIPQNTEGVELLTVSHTPASASNLLEIRAWVPIINNSGAADLTLALFQDSVADALAVCSATHGTAAYRIPMGIVHAMTAGSTSAITFKLRAAAGGGTTYINRTSAINPLLGGVAAVVLEVLEFTP